MNTFIVVKYYMHSLFMEQWIGELCLWESDMLIIYFNFFSQPLFLNEVLVKMPPDPSSDEPLFHVSHIDRVYTLKTETLNER